MKINMQAADIAFGVCVAVFLFALRYDHRWEKRRDDEKGP